ncbi:hypothetical protein M8C21_015363 [Ambrosia artemisiifolia]|uniref:Uncharacterized protein n=1 Tax=Ambrosia artemisiifolia TaxID=4212 RepID=A0AAD5C0W5_AMBAR|nr:hypothetical protein M8C21_015363 [Ambrosia artemisiifolia]
MMVQVNFNQHSERRERGRENLDNLTVRSRWLEVVVLFIVAVVVSNEEAVPGVRVDCMPAITHTEEEDYDG